MSVSFSPLLPLWVLYGTVAAIVLALILNRGVSWIRGLGLLAIVLALAGPRMVHEIRAAVPDIALIVVDQSHSQSLRDRQPRSDRALAQLQEQLRAYPDLETRIIRVGADSSLSDGTLLFKAVDQALADIPKQRLAGVIMITDGVVHDIPLDKGRSLGGPVHILLTGDHNEQDRRVAMVGTPDFAVVGKDATVRFKVLGELPELPIRVEVDGSVFMEQSMPADKDLAVDIPIRHAGQTVVDISVAPGPHELTLENNHAIIGLSGIRDRLKVLLISGVPHSGERSWRNLLKADPGVDLVHFTILRSPDKDDPTPINELALISFPVKELFEERLPHFDLVILDRFRGGELPRSYLPRLSDYVQNGGALLLAAGPELSDPNGLGQSALADILPTQAMDAPVNQPIKPTLSPEGKRHPVMADLMALDGHWGRWLRYIPTQIKQGSALLETPDGKPLVVLAHVGEGRVAEILSDTGWLWARGWEGGGPYREMLRRMAHWLMKEPELEEESLSAQIKEGSLTVTRHSLSNTLPTITVTGPDQKQTALTLTDHEDGTQTASMPATGGGIWRLSDGSKTAIALSGDPSPLELSEVVGTDHGLAPVATATGGSLTWLVDGDIPAIHRTGSNGTQAGQGWMGMIARGDSVVTGLSQSSSWPSLVLMIIAAGFLVMAWLREAR